MSRSAPLCAAIISTINLFECRAEKLAAQGGWAVAKVLTFYLVYELSIF